MKEKRNSASLFGLLMENYLSDEEESSDESFRVEDHTEQSDLSNDDDEDTDDDSSDNGKSDDSDETKMQKANKKHINNADSTSKTTATVVSAIEKLAEQAKSSANITEKLLSTPICCACLSDRSDDSNEIVTCDCCRITVHEGCYGVSDTASISSTVSSCSTEPWFCEPCKANVKNPDCELCPNKGGIFKETDCGKWVHLVCALYVPGVAFGEVDQLSSVTLFEMQYNKWGAKTCSLCENDHFARTGVCIGCDAGMCKNFFHVTCAQREGLLSEAHHEEVDQADPFYAHCRVHSDKFLIKHRKKNFNALVMQVKRHEAFEVEKIEKNLKPSEEQERIERKLKMQRIKYATHKMNRPEPWVPTQKMSRALVTSASAVKKLTKKADLMEIDSVALEFQEAQIASLTDIRKKWHIPPAFSTEFVGYYLDRSIRMREMKTNSEQQVECNKSLLEQQSILRIKYDDAIKINQDVQQKQKDLVLEIEQLHNAILTICPNKQLQSIESIGIPPASTLIKHHMEMGSAVASPLPATPPQMLASRPMSVPTAAARKQGVGFPLNSISKDDTGRILSTQCPSNISSNNDELLNECGICKKCQDQHLLAKCDTCHLYYHLGCLNPPLTRHPKKSKLYAWQCSECDKSDHSDDQTSLVIPKGPRKSRNIRYSKEGIFSSDLHDSFGSDKSLNNFSSASSPIRIPNGGGGGYDVIDLTLATSSTKIPDIIIEEAAAASNNVQSSTPPTPIVEVKVPPPAKKKRRESISLSAAAAIKKAANLSPVKKCKKIKIKTDTITELPKQEQEKTQEKPVSQEPINVNVSDMSINLSELQNPATTSIGSGESLLLLNNSTKKTLNKPKRGRRPKNSKAGSDDKKKHSDQSPEMPMKSEKSGLLDLSQYRAFANIPNSIQPSTQQDQDQDIKTDVINKELITTNLIMMNGIKTLNGDGSNMVDHSISDIVLGGSGHHKHKKRKSHKRRHSHSPSSADRQSTSSGKKHKRKHKHRDLEQTSESEHRPINDEQSSIEQPRIKIKFRAILQNAGDDKKPPKFLWHVPNENDAISLASVSEQRNQIESPIGNGHHHNGNENGKKRKSQQQNSTKMKKIPRLLMSLSPNKKDTAQINTELSNQPLENETTASTALLQRSLPLPDEVCDVCNGVGVSQHFVKCDECLKNYHFHCLIPPLKKTPKKRGYSWICADCDPTDRENN